MLSYKDELDARNSKSIKEEYKQVSAMEVTDFLKWYHYYYIYWGFPCGSAGKESACNAGDLGSIPGLWRYPGEGKGYPLQYSGLENSMDCIVHGSQRVRHDWVTFTFTYYVPGLYWVLKCIVWFDFPNNPQNTEAWCYFIEDETEAQKFGNLPQVSGGARVQILMVWLQKMLFLPLRATLPPHDRNLSDF